MDLLRSEDFILKKENSYQTFIEILDKLPSSIIIINTETRICFVNEAYCKMFGISRDRILNHQLKKFEPLARIQVVLKENKPLIGDISHIESANIDVCANISPIFSKNKKIIGAVAIMNDVTEISRCNQEIDYFKSINKSLREQLNISTELPSSFSHIISRTPSYINVLKVAARVSQTNASVAITGESGCGKEMIAEAIHYASKRADGPLIKVNCAAIPESLFESELFGYEKGAFTGARHNGKPGKFELADKGTIFLDEVGELPLNMQVKLLRVLQEREIERVGGTSRIPIDFRLITATNRDLSSMIEQGTFREDLFYRLNVIPLKIPPLKNRREDIPELVNIFLDELCNMYDRKVRITEQVMMALINYNWPGNVRELKNLVEQIYILCPSDSIDIFDLPQHLIHNTTSTKKEKITTYKLNDIIENTEKKAILSALQMVNNNKTKAIELLGISRRSFYQKLEKYQLC